MCQQKSLVATLFSQQVKSVRKQFLRFLGGPRAKMVKGDMVHSCSDFLPMTLKFSGRVGCADVVRKRRPSSLDVTKKGCSHSWVRCG